MRSTPLHPSQYEVYIDQLMHPDSPHYNVGFYIKLTGQIDVAILQRSLRDCVEKYDSFSQRFNLDEAEPKAFIADCISNFQFHKLDFSTTTNPPVQAKEWMQQQFNTPFKLNVATPPFEFALLKTGPNEQWLYFRFHHLIIDGYGIKIFIDEVALTYKRHLN